MAVVRSATAAHILFDPNFGMFIGRAPGEAAGVEHLVTRVYPEARCVEYVVLTAAG